MRMHHGALLLAGLSVALLAAPSPEVRAADHGDAPGVRLNSRLDINDLYAFQSPADPANVVFIMTVCPLAGTLSPAEFATGSKYEFHVDSTGDAVADFGFRFTFGKRNATTGVQRVKLKGFGANTQDRTSGDTGTDVSIPGGGTFRAGLFDDPFFFDLVGFRAGLMFSDPGSVDFFRGFNTMAIVLEVPRTKFGTDDIGVWATTKRAKQVDRAGRPAVATVLIPPALKDAFNAGKPANDRAAFGDAVRASLIALGNDAPTAAGLADVLLPDVLTIDTSDAGGFLNGRRLEDDVIDIELNLLSDGAVPTDFVDANDKPFLTTFPYLASPH
jgi:hypothetical protein